MFSLSVHTFFLNSIVPVSLVVLIIVLYFKIKFVYWKNKNVYTEQPKIPFGNAYDLIRHKQSHGEEFQKMYNIFKSKNLPYGGYYAFMKAVFIPTDLDLIKNILTNDFEHFMDHLIYVNEQVEPIGVNLITLKGLKWKRLRAKLTPTFTSAKMKNMFPTLLDCSKGLCRAVARQMEAVGTTDVKDIVARYTTDVVGSCIFGLECNSLENNEDPFRLVGKTFFDVSSSGNAVVQLLSFLTPGLLAFLRVRLIDPKISVLFTDIVKNNVEYRQNNNVKRNDFLQLLMEMKDDDSTGEKFTMGQLVAQCFQFFLAGFETSSSTLTYCLYELAINTMFQEKLRLEVSEVLKRHQGEITYNALSDMTYMDQCINETLRKYPVIPVHTRECTKTYQIPNSGLVLEKGTYVMVPVLGIHRDPEHYPNPDEFNPRRFSKDNLAKRHPCAWIPFGAGPRTCIAERFGMLQIKVCLTALLRNYSFTLNLKTEIPLTFDSRSTTILVPNGDILINMQKLDKVE